MIIAETGKRSLRYDVDESAHEDYRKSYTMNRDRHKSIIGNVQRVIIDLLGDLILDVTSIRGRSRRSGFVVFASLRVSFA